MPLNRTVFSLAGLAGIILIAACAPEIEGRLYLQDITEVADSGKPIIATAQLRIPETSEDDCNKGLERLAGKLGTITPLSDTGECVEVDNNQFSQFSMDLPIVVAGAKLDQDYLAELVVSKADNSAGQGITLGLKMNRTLKEVQDAVGRSDTNGITLKSSSGEDQPKFIFTVENDMRDPVRLVPDNVFVDDEPAIAGLTPEIVLDRRDSVKIRFSDVISAYIANANTFSFATLYPGES